ncbi:MAG: DegQ family serine endoprotease [Acidobacteria bacterium]|nr:DegQ family serine endoprotease [Acidobacteriota bacterium]
MSSRLAIGSLVAALGIGGLAGSWATAKSGRSFLGTVEPVAMYVSDPGGAAIGQQVSFLNGFAPVARKVLPAVVNIASSKIVRSSGQGPSSPFFSDPFFRQFFGGQFSPQSRVPSEEREHSLGSGVIVNANGYVLTNNHVVSGADEITVSLGDKREFKGHIVGTDAKTDVAVVKIDGKNLPFLTLGDSSKVQVGDFALAVGNPFGIGRTLTMGIISATGRGGLGIEDYEDFLQTDAAINPGNSGGALVNVRGELVGINTAIIAGGGGGNQGVGFAIPVNMARAVMDQIIEHGKVLRGSIGVLIQPVTPALAKSFGLTGEPRGALVANVTPDSPADRAGLKRGDIILALNGAPMGDSRDLSLKVSMMAPGTPVKLTVFRDGREQEYSLTLAQLPDAAEAPGGPAANQSAGPRLGISVDRLTPDVASQLGLSARTTGVVVTGVQPAGPAEDAGLRRGDVIQEIDHKAVAGVEQFRDAVRQAGNSPVLLLIDRGGDHIFVVVTPK